MTDARFKATCKKVDKILDSWIQKMKLGDWDIRWVHMRDFHDTERERCAECAASWEYMQISINFFIPALEGRKDEEIGQIVIHELLHGVVNEMRMVSPEMLSRQLENEAMCHEERVVSHLTSIIFNAYNG